MQFIDLSHVIEENLITYRGLPAPVMCDYFTREESRQFYEAGTEFQIGKIEMVGNTGTYLDSPFHRYADGKDLSDLSLDALAHLEGVVVRVHEEVKAIDASYFQHLDLEGKAVLVQTGWDRFWMQELYFHNNPFLTKDAAEFLVTAKVRLVGIDSHNIDDTSRKARPVHTILLKHEILIVEHLCNLKALPDAGFHFHAVPPKVKHFGTFPVRAFATVQS
jgi:kynurenine formamidase